MAKHCDIDCQIDKAVASYETKRQRKDKMHSEAGSAPKKSKKQDRGNILTGGIKAINKAKEKRSKY
jgi:hypothetical protein